LPFCLLKIYPPRGEVLSVAEKRYSNILPDRRLLRQGNKGAPIREVDGAKEPRLFSILEVVS
jgi:hypothetical protein